MNKTLAVSHPILAEPSLTKMPHENASHSGHPRLPWRSPAEGLSGTAVGTGMASSLPDPVPRRGPTSCSWESGEDGILLAGPSALDGSRRKTPRAFKTSEVDRRGGSDARSGRMSLARPSSSPLSRTRSASLLPVDASHRPRVPRSRQHSLRAAEARRGRRTSSLVARELPPVGDSRSSFLSRVPRSPLRKRARLGQLAGSPRFPVSTLPED